MSSTGNSSGETEQDDFYDAAPLEPHLIYQGEIVAGLPFFNMHKESRWLLVRTKSGLQIHEALQNGKLGGLVKVLDSNQSKIQWELNDGDFAIGQLSKAPVLVLSQTCDCQNKNFIQVAPIFTGGDAGYLTKIKNGDVLSAFWIKKRPPQIPEDGYADFELIQAIHKSYRKNPPPEAEHFRLNPDKTLDLQRSVTRYFGRPNSFDVGSDKAPRTGSYLCVNCFYWDGRISKVSMNEGDGFQPCEGCHGTQWVPQLGSFS